MELTKRGVLGARLSRMAMLPKKYPAQDAAPAAMRVAMRARGFVTTVQSILCSRETNLRMLLTVFGSDGGGKARAPSESGGDKMVLRVSHLGHLDARVYASQASRLRTEADVSALVNEVYNAGMELVRVKALCLLNTDEPLQPGSQVTTRASMRKLERALNHAQERLHSTASTSLNSATTASPVQRQYAFELYSSFTRALHAASVCAQSVGEVKGVEVKRIRDEWQEKNDMSTYGFMTLHAGDQIAELVTAAENEVAKCIADVDRLRRAHVHRHTPVELTLELHISTCKSFLAEVRKWAERFSTL